MTIYCFLITIISYGIKSVISLSFNSIAVTQVVNVVLTTLLIGSGCYAISRYKNVKPRYNCLTLHVVDYQKIWFKYIQNNPHIIGIIPESEDADVQVIKNEVIMRQQTQFIPTKKAIVTFNDTNFNVAGYYVRDTTSYPIGYNVEKKQNIIQEATIIKIYIDYQVDTTCYFDKVKKSVTEFEQKNNHTYEISLHQYNDTRIIKLDKPLPELESNYISTFFHPQRDEIWNHLKNICFNPEIFTNVGQQCSAGYIFYGPPGTGKSSFIYRLGVALHCSIKIIDDFSQSTPSELFNRFKSVKIIVFDEIDISLDKICDRQNKIDKMNSDVSTLSKEALTELKDLEKLITIRDLLGLFQGVAPFDGIIIATTNYFDKIKTLCPALVRAGRLTPVLFDVPNLETINQMSMRFFKRRCVNQTYTTTKSYPEFIEQIIKYNNQPNGFVKWQEFVNLSAQS